MIVVFYCDRGEFDNVFILFVDVIDNELVGLKSLCCILVISVRMIFNVIYLKVMFGRVVNESF